MTISAYTAAERRGVGLLALVSIGILVATMMLGLRASPSLAVVAEPECLNPLDVVFILDKSGSMDTAAGDSTRLGEARDAILGFIDDLEGNGGVGTGKLHQVGLTTYAGTTASTPLALGGTSAAGASDIVDNIADDAGSGNTPLGVGMSQGMANMAGGDRDFVAGVPVTHAFVLLSDGRPWLDVENDIQRPTSTLIGNYLGAVDQAFSIMLGTSLNVPPPSAFILDPVLMDKLDKPDSAADPADGVPGGNFLHIQDAGELGDIFDTIVSDLLCGDIEIDKTVDPDSLPAGGGEVDYEFRVSHIGKQGSAPFTEVELTDTLGAAPGGDPGCEPVRGADDPGDNDALLEPGETWVYTCSDVEINETTQNWGCVTAEYVNSDGATTTDCDDATVVVQEAPPDVPDIKIRKSHDATGTVEPGTEVTYTYKVENTGDTALSNVHVTDLIVGSDDVACEPLVRGTDISGNNDAVLGVDEIWSFSCSTELEETTANRACVTADSSATQSSVRDCDTEEVEVSQSPEQSVEAGTGTPVESQPDTSLGGSGGGVLATIMFSFVLIGSLGTLAFANVRAMRRRS